MNRHTFRHVAVVLGVGASLALAACGDDTDEAAGTTAAAAATDAAGGESSAGLTVDGAWARTSPMMASAGAAYMTLTSASDDAVVRASVDASIAGTVELHETRMVETDGDMGGDMTATTMEGMGGDMTGTTMEGMDGMDGMGAMEMVEVEKIDLPAGQAVSLEPGGLHVMLLDLVAPLEVGTTIQVTLELESGATQVVDVPVRDEAP
jgi:copper(I)-binding protein